LSQKLGKNLNPKLGEMLRPISIPDLGGDKSHCPTFIKRWLSRSCGLRAVFTVFSFDCTGRLSTRYLTV